MDMQNVLKEAAMGTAFLEAIYAMDTATATIVTMRIPKCAVSE